jgi:hypothetical protein
MSAPSFTSFPTLPAPDTASSSKLSDVSKKGGNDQSAKRTSSSIPPHEKSIKRKRSRLARDVVGYEGDGSDFHAASPATSHGRGSRYSRSSHREISTGIRTTHHELGVDRYAAGTSRSEWHYTDIVGDKEAHLYGPTTSSSCPHYRRDQSTLSTQERRANCRWTSFGTARTIEVHEDWGKVKPGHRDCQAGSTICESSERSELTSRFPGTLIGHGKRKSICGSG